MRRPKSIAVLGHRGAIGSAVAGALSGHADVEVLAIGRIVEGEPLPRQAAEALSRSNVVINCAGAATAGARPGALAYVNSELPLRLWDSAEAAGVERFIQISTAAVQGRRPVLDESLELAPFSPYSASKAEAERRLAARAESSAMSLHIYRPTSVMGEDQAATRSLVRLARLPLPVIGNGDRPIPLAHITRVADVVVALALCREPPLVALHPWEGVTQRLLLEVFGRRTPRSVSPHIDHLLTLGIAIFKTPSLAAHVRRIELLMRGQGQNAVALANCGISVDQSLDPYRHLVETVLEAGAGP